MIRYIKLLYKLFIISTIVLWNIDYGQSLGIWTSSAELKNIPMNGPAWEVLLQNADEADGNDAYISDQNYNNNVQILASAIVYARTGLQEYKDKVVKSCEKLVNDGYPPAVPNTGRNDYNRTLAWGRETGAYVLAADLVGYRTPGFEQWCRNVAEVWQDAANSWTLLYTFKHRPQNWGTHAFSSLAAIYAYLQDNARLDEIYNDEVGMLLGNPPPETSYGSDLSWQYDENNPVEINPKGAVKQGINIDGIAPDDMRRGGSLSATPAHTGYAWEFLQGILPGVRIMHRLGYPILSVADSAFARAVYALQVRLASQDSYWYASGDDEWQLPYWDEMFGTHYSDAYPKSADPAVSRIYDRGKNAGWGYVTLANQVKTINTTVSGNGTIVLDTPDGRYLEGAVATLTADPSLGWVFDHWEGDLTGTSNPASLTIDADKNVTAVFVQSQTTQYTLTVVNSGSGNVTLSPPGGNYDAGTVVTLTANPSPGWRLENWSGDLTGTTNPTTITMDSDKNVTAVYSQATALPVSSVIASADDGNVPANTLDNDLNTRWSADGAGQWIQYDLGLVHTISYISLASYKGDQRNYYFDIEVSIDATNWTQVFSGSSDGTTTAQQEYHFADTDGRYLRIVGHSNSYNTWNSYTEVDIFGKDKTTFVSIMGVPTEYNISQNYPNPFNPSTTIIYELPKVSYVTLKIYDLLGKEVKELVSERKAAGMYKVMWDGLDNSGKKVTNGIYFYKITAGEFINTKKMLLIK